MAIKSHQDLIVFSRSFEAAMAIFELSRDFPKAEMYSLTDQIRRSSKSAAANITEAWRKQRYEAAFVSKLSDAETEAAETQTWIQFSLRCGYLDGATADGLMHEYDEIIAMLVDMMVHSKRWCFTTSRPME